MESEDFILTNQPPRELTDHPSASPTNPSSAPPVAKPPVAKRPADECLDEYYADGYPADRYPADECSTGEHHSYQCCADKYLRETPWRSWDIVDYMEKNKLMDFEQLRASWRKGLKILQTSGTPDEIKTANSLLNKFHGNDGKRARQWRDRDKPSSSGVVIKNSFNHSTVQFPPDPVQKSLPKQNKAKGKAPIEPRSDAQGPKKKKKDMASINALFTKTYRDMSNDKKWLLPSKNYVEDILHSKFSGHQYELPVHSWIIDTSDLDGNIVKDCFEENDWKAIYDKVKQLPQPDKLLVNSMMRFMPAKSTDELWNFVHKTTFLKPGEIRNETNRGPEWVDFVMNFLLPMYESGSFFDKNNLENWYTVNVWYPIFDRCMLTIQGAHVSRGESKSISVSSRKNPHTYDPTKRRKIGHLYDGLLRIDGKEAGVIEHAREFEADTSLKWYSDSLKVVKALRDMLRQQSSKSLREVSVIGFVTAGLEFQLLHMNYGEGNICLLSKEEEACFPSKMADFQNIFKLLVMFWKYRTLMLDFKNAITLKTQTPEELAGSLMESSSEDSEPRCSLLPSIETDGEACENSVE